MRANSPSCLRRSLLAACSPLVLAAGLFASADAAAQVNSVTTSGGTLVNQGLVGVGHLSASLRDKYGETFGSMSALTFDAKSWRRSGNSYTGTLFTLPDRGYNVVGTTDYRPRYNTVGMSFTPYSGSAATTAQNQLSLTLQDTTLFTEANGTPLTGLDPQPGSGGTRPASGGLPVLPQGYNGKISLDPEGIVRLSDGSFFVSDEYGPNIYHFAANGTLLSATQPPAALLPIRNGIQDYSSNNPATGQPTPVPADPTTGRQNNQGLEGLTITPDHKQLAALLQSATRQDGGTGGSSATRYNTRLLIYSVTNPDSPVLTGHYVVQLPRFTAANGTTQVAAQSEMLALNDKQFLVLSRDSGNGQGLSGTTSLYRSIDLIDISSATNLVGTAYEGTTPVAPGGSLVAAVTPVSFQRFIDINNNAQLSRFGLHNGAPNNTNNLSEKWEAMGLLPVLDAARPDDFFLFVGNDNDFLTSNGYQVGAPYNAGTDVDTMILVYRLELPTYVDPVAVESLRVTALPLARGLGVAAIDQADAAARTLDSHLAALAAGRLLGGVSAERPFSVYVAGSLDIARTDGERTEGDARSHEGVVMVGADARIDERFTAGVAVGWGKDNLSVRGSGSADYRSVSVNPYVAATIGRFAGSLSLTYGWNDYSSIVRDTGAYGLYGRGDTSGRTLGAGTSIGYDFGEGEWSYGPVAGARYTHLTIDGYSESDAIHLNADMPKQRLNAWSAQLGGQVSRRFQTDAVTIVPQARLGYEWSRVGGETLSATLSNRRTSTMGTVSSSFSALDRNGVRVGAGVTLGFGSLSWQVGYDGKFGGDLKTHSVMTSLAYTF